VTLSSVCSGLHGIFQWDLLHFKAESLSSGTETVSPHLNWRRIPHLNCLGGRLAGSQSPRVASEDLAIALDFEEVPLQDGPDPPAAVVIRHPVELRQPTPQGTPDRSRESAAEETPDLVPPSSVLEVLGIARLLPLLLLS